MTRHLSRLRSHLTYGNVVATIALAAALGTGGAYAASLAKNSVGPKQIRKGAVGSRAVKNHSIARRDLSASARAQGASVSRDGALTGGSAISASRDASVNGYVVAFKNPVSRCAFATALHPQVGGEPPAGSATVIGKSPNEVTVATYDAAGVPTLASFDLVVVC